MNIYQNEYSAPDTKKLEVVERKGIGHPDTLADGIAEKISIEYSKYCLDKFGFILHHNVDKVCVMGGLAEINWGASKFKEPVRILINGRMSKSFAGTQIPLEEINEKAIKDYLSKTLPHLNLEKDLLIINETTQYTRNPTWFNPKEEKDLPELSKMFANDTSAVVSSYPLTLTEQLPLELEGLFYDKEGNPKYDFIGQDIKVMIIRKEKHYSITMCIPFFAEYVKNFDSYLKQKENIVNIVQNYLNERLKEPITFELFINTQDQNARTIRNLYVVSAGSSTDFGEEGCVGRGNNRQGIIPMFRTHSMEAAWGKNPVYHTGKVYGVIVDTLAKEISLAFKSNVEVMIVTRMGDPFFSPHSVTVSSSKKIDQKELNNFIKTFFKRRDWTEKIIFEECLLPKVLPKQ